jgi:hypothetical protein
MFKKIVSQISLSPATVEQVALYAKRVQKKRALYGWAAIILATTSILYSLVMVFNPAYTSSPSANDLVPGGLPTKESILSAYDMNTGGFRDAATLFSMSRDDIARVTSACDKSPIAYTTGRVSYGDASDESVHLLANESPIYIRAVDPSVVLDMWCGTTGHGDSFAIVKADGNIVTSSTPKATPKTTLLTRTITADRDTAKPGESLIWRLLAVNTSQDTTTQDLWLDIGDLSEYGHVTAASQDGIISNQEHRILWPDITVAPGESVALTVDAVIYTPIDETARQRHNLQSHDCKISLSFGNNSEVSLSCPLTKQTEQIFSSLPPIHNIVSLALCIVLFLISLTCYLSLSLQLKELRIIRTQVNTGGSL